MRNGRVLVLRTLDASRPHRLIPEPGTGLPEEPAMILMFRPTAACVSAAPLGLHHEHHVRVGDDLAGDRGARRQDRCSQAAWKAPRHDVVRIEVIEPVRDPVDGGAVNQHQSHRPGWRSASRPGRPSRSARGSHIASARTVDRVVGDTLEFHRRAARKPNGGIRRHSSSSLMRSSPLVMTRGDDAFRWMSAGTPGHLVETATRRCQCGASTPRRGACQAQTHYERTSCAVKLLTRSVLK